MKNVNYEDYVKPEVQVVEMDLECTILNGSQTDNIDQIEGATVNDFGDWSVWGN